jgi:hypothetical protein
MHHQWGGGLPDHPALTRTSNRRSRERRRFRLRVALGSLALGIVGLLVPAIAAAHDGGTAMGISLSAERLPPSGALEIIGQGFLGDEVIDITLVGGGSDVALGAVRASAEGGFAIVLTVPPDTMAGSYRVDATVASGIVQQADVVVDAAAPAPALTPTPADLLAPSAAGREDPFWIWAPLAVALIATVAFATLTRRRMVSARRDALVAASRGESTQPG